MYMYPQANSKHSIIRDPSMYLFKVLIKIPFFKPLKAHNICRVVLNRTVNKKSLNEESHSAVTCCLSSKINPLDMISET